MTLPADSGRAARLLELVGANWTTQAIGAAVALGIVDALAQAACDVRLLARRTCREFARMGKQDGFEAPRRIAMALEYSVLEATPVPARPSGAARQRRPA